MNILAQSQFVHNYSRLLVDVWTNKQDFDQLLKDPVPILNKYDLPTKPGAQIMIDEVGSSTGIDQNAGLQVQITAWEHGDQSGKYVLYVPKVPQIHIDSSTNAIAADSCCCCCCPCCSCT